MCWRNASPLSSALQYHAAEMQNGSS